jgi:hypothetical protein
MSVSGFNHGDGKVLPAVVAPLELWDFLQIHDRLLRYIELFGGRFDNQRTIRDRCECGIAHTPQYLYFMRTRWHVMSYPVE